MKNVTIINAPDQPNLIGQTGIIIAKRKDTNESAVRLNDGKYVWIHNDNLIKNKS